TFRAGTRRRRRHARLRRRGGRVRGLSLELSAAFRGAARQQGIDRRRRNFADHRRSRCVELRRGADSGDAAAHEPRRRARRRCRQSRVRYDREVRAHAGRAVSRRERSRWIIYRKSPPLRLQRVPIPEPPYWAATIIAPYSSRRAEPIAIDYLDLQATRADRFEVAVCDDVRDELERAAERARVREPVLIEATESAEVVFRRGEEALEFCTENDSAAIHLVSSRGALPDGSPDGATVAIAPWPLDFDRVQALFDEARARALRWGVVVPVMYPVTTDLVALAQLAEAAHGATFFAALPIDLDASARKAIAEDESYEMLFHADLEPIHVA